MVSYRGHTAVFPAENGYITVDGNRKEHPYFGGCIKDGRAYCSVYALTTALGLYGYADSQTKGSLITPYNLAQREDLLKRAWNEIAALQLKRYEDAKGYLALTFDDGPSGEITSRLLDGLKRRYRRYILFVQLPDSDIPWEHVSVFGRGTWFGKTTRRTTRF